MITTVGLLYLIFKQGFSLIQFPLGPKGKNPPLATADTM